MDDLTFLQEARRGHATVKIWDGNQETFKIVGLEHDFLAQAAPLFAHAFEPGRSGPLFVFENQTSAAAVASLIRYCYLGFYAMCPAHALDEPISLLTNLEVYRLADLFEVSGLRHQVLQRVNSDIKASKDSAIPVIELIEGIRYLYLELRTDCNLRNTVAHYCVDNFVEHGLNTNMALAQTIYESPLFHSDLQVANNLNGFASAGAGLIMQLKTCEDRSHDFKALQLPMGDFLCALHVGKQQEVAREQRFTDEGLPILTPVNPVPALEIEAVPDVSCSQRRELSRESRRALLSSVQSSLIANGVKFQKEHDPSLTTDNMVHVKHPVKEEEDSSDYVPVFTPSSDSEWSLVGNEQDGEARGRDRASRANVNASAKAEGHVSQNLLKGKTRELPIRDSSTNAKNDNGSKKPETLMDLCRDAFDFSEEPTTESTTQIVERMILEHRARASQAPSKRAGPSRYPGLHANNAPPSRKLGWHAPLRDYGTTETSHLTSTHGESATIPSAHKHFRAPEHQLPPKPPKEVCMDVDEVSMQGLDAAGGTRRLSGTYARSPKKTTQARAMHKKSIRAAATRSELTAGLETISGASSRRTNDVEMQGVVKREPVDEEMIDYVDASKFRILSPQSSNKEKQSPEQGFTIVGEDDWVLADNSDSDGGVTLKIKDAGRQSG